MMKKIIFIALAFLIIECVYAEDFSKVSVNGNEFDTHWEINREMLMSIMT